jgi:long-subunit acyl-CoA synthetase (AMP-forming)
VPEIYELFCRLRDPNVELPSLKTFVSGGSKLDRSGYERIRSAFSIDLLHGYGLTEFTPISRNIRGMARPGTIGPLCEGLELRIGSPLADGSGEIQVRGPSVAKGYYRRPRESGEAFQEGWFRTGDLGSLDGEHLLYLEEIKRTRKINGNIVDLAEVTRALMVDPEVIEADVSLKEGILEARVAIRAGIDFRVKSQSLRSSLRGLLAEYKIPRRFVQF